MPRYGREVGTTFLQAQCCRACFTQAWPVLDVFKWMAAVGRVAADEMARTFNLGIGMVVVVDQADANEAEEVRWN